METVQEDWKEGKIGKMADGEGRAGVVYGPSGGASFRKRGSSVELFAVKLFVQTNAKELNLSCRSLIRFYFFFTVSPSFYLVTLSPYLPTFNRFDDGPKPKMTGNRCRGFK